MKKRIYFMLTLTGFICLFPGCKKESTPAATTTTTTPATPAQILNTEANIVIEGNYATFAANAQSLYKGLVQLQSSATATNFTNCRNLWLTATAAYELCESFNFGPTSLNGDDQLINTFPVDTALIDTTVNSKADFTQGYIDSLPGNYKGFHCIEFELYGGNGNKTVSQVNARQLIYMVSLALNIQTWAQQLDSAWNPSVAGNYNVQFVNAGNGSTKYTDQKAAFEDLVYGLANYCEIDEIQKLNIPLVNQESPYANNTVTDIVNNLIGIQNCYYGQYGSASGPGLTALVSQYNLTLDNKIKSDITTAINEVEKITPNYTQEYTANHAVIQTAINYCDTLDKELKNQLLPFVTANVK